MFKLAPTTELVLRLISDTLSYFDGDGFLLGPVLPTSRHASSYRPPFLKVLRMSPQRCIVRRMHVHAQLHTWLEVTMRRGNWAHGKVFLRMEPLTLEIRGYGARRMSR